MEPQKTSVASLDEYAEQVLERAIVDAIEQVKLVREEATDEKSIEEFSENALQPAVHNAVNKVEINPGGFQFFLNYRSLQIGLLLEGTAFLLIVCIVFGLFFGIEPLIQLFAIYCNRQ